MKTVFVVDDSPGIRDSIALHCESVDLAWRTYQDGLEFLEDIKGDERGCILVDVRMPRLSGLEVLRALGRRGCHLPTIIMTGHGDVSTAIEAMKQGAFDFLEKPFSAQCLLDTIHRAMEHEVQIFQKQVQNREVSRRLASLTPREQQVLDCVVDGRSSRKIALELGISQKTIEVHRANIMRKMDVSSVAGLVRVVVSLQASGDFEAWNTEDRGQPTLSS